MISKLHIGIIFIVLGLTGVFIYAQPEQPVGEQPVKLTEIEKLESINNIQTIELSKGHYKHIPRTNVTDNDFQVDEYELPNREVGYTITQWKTEGEKELKRVIDYGSLNRDLDWTVINDNTASSTSSNPFMDLLYAFTPKVYAIVQTHSTNLVAASTQFWNITDAAQTGLDFTGDFSIEAWIKADILANSRIIAKDQSNGGNNDPYFFYLRETGDIAIQYGSGSARTQHSTNDTPISTGTWFHVAATVDVSAKDVKFYIDGVQDTNITKFLDAATSVADNTNANVYVGSGNGEQYYDGLLNDVRVWNDIRTGAEINDNKDNCDLSVSEAGLISWWLFNNDGIDAHANGNDLTNNNSATFSTDLPYECAVVAEEVSNSQVNIIGM